MLKHSTNKLVERKKANGIIGWFGIPKNLRTKVLDIMIDENLIKVLNRDKIKIIHSEKSKDVDKKVLEEIWGDIILGK